MDLDHFWAVVKTAAVSFFFSFGLSTFRPNLLSFTLSIIFLVQMTLILSEI